MTDFILQAKKVGKGETVTMKREQKEPTPPFWKMGHDMDYNRSRFPTYPDITGTMKFLSKGATWLFWQLMETRKIETNICEYTPKDRTETMKVHRAFKELKAKDLVRRVRRSHYIFNPAVWEPITENYEKVFIHWESLKGK